MKEKLLKILDTIENNDLRSLAEEMCDTIPEYWYSVPASSTGKFHPDFALGTGGLLRHTVALIKILNYMFDSSDEFTSRERDLLRIAGLMHDTRKSGTQEQYNASSYTKFEHPLYAAEVVRTFKGKGYNDVEIEKIATSIESHMGKWNTSNYSKTVLPIPQNRMQTVLHQADYLASRKGMEIVTDDYIAEEQAENKSASTENSQSVNTENIPSVMPFGKYKGETLVDIQKKDEQYLKWCLSTLDLSRPLKNAISSVVS